MSEIRAACKTADSPPYIRITCKAADFLPLESIEEFQGNFKKRTKKEIHQIIVSILKFGFSFPFFAWRYNGRHWCLDGPAESSRYGK
jgi:hypothetical protein